MSSSSGRTTCYSQKATTLGDSLSSVGSRLLTTSRPITLPPHLSDFTFPPIPEANKDLSLAEGSISYHNNHSSDHHSNHSSNCNQVVDPEVSLAQSLMLLVKKIDVMPHSKKRSVKPREPDLFDGTDPNKSDNYIFQLTLYLAAISNDFLDNNMQITFALSYLKGTLLDWFQSEIIHVLATGNTFPVWSTSIATFLTKLWCLFGPKMLLTTLWMHLRLSSTRIWPRPPATPSISTNMTERLAGMRRHSPGSIIRVFWTDWKMRLFALVSLIL